jgi:hypothetical protein
MKTMKVFAAAAQEVMPIEEHLHYWTCVYCHKCQMPECGIHEFLKIGGLESGRCTCDENPGYRQFFVDLRNAVPTQSQRGNDIEQGFGNCNF